MAVHKEFYRLPSEVVMVRIVIFNICEYECQCEYFILIFANANANIFFHFYVNYFMTCDIKLEKFWIFSEIDEPLDFNKI